VPLERQLTLEIDTGSAAPDADQVCLTVPPDQRSNFTLDDGAIDAVPITADEGRDTSALVRLGEDNSCPDAVPSNAQPADAGERRLLPLQSGHGRLSGVALAVQASDAPSCAR